MGFIADMVGTTVDAACMVIVVWVAVVVVFGVGALTWNAIQGVRRRQRERREG